MQKQTWSFGSFVCFRRFPRIFRDDSSEVMKPGVSSQVVAECLAATTSLTLDGRCTTADHGYFDAEGNLHLLPNTVEPIAPRRCA